LIFNISIKTTLSQFDNTIRIEIGNQEPPMVTWAKNDDDIIVAVKEAIKSYIIIYNKFEDGTYSINPTNPYED
jgi:hypothetical protein